MKLCATKIHKITIFDFLNWIIVGKSFFNHKYWLNYHQDLDGFVVIYLWEKIRTQWPSPKLVRNFGFPHEPFVSFGNSLESLPSHIDKPIAAATIRAGLGYLEIPFFATLMRRRKRGFGRSLLEAITEVARSLCINKLMLCSESSVNTCSIWNKMGFVKTQNQHLKILNVKLKEMLHMSNTSQMHKFVTCYQSWKSLIIKHKHFKKKVFLD
jgi:ribosomal protein S18 acetylase RimI-like enzyme